MPKNKLKKPSEEFKDAICYASSIMIECELCDITYLGSDENAIKESLGEKEYKELKEDMKRNPKKYIHDPEDMISWGRIDGKQAVIGCPCNKLSLYENLFWNSRHIIADYFLSRTKRELREAEENKNLATKLKEVIK